MDVSDFFDHMVARPIATLDNLPTCTSEQLHSHPAGHSETIAELLLQVGRSVDTEVAALNGQGEVWDSEDFQDALADTSTAELAPLIDYARSCLYICADYLATCSDDELSEPIEPQDGEEVEVESESSDEEAKDTRGGRMIDIVLEATERLAKIEFAMNSF